MIEEEIESSCEILDRFSRKIFEGDHAKVRAWLLEGSRQYGDICVYLSSPYDKFVSVSDFLAMYS